MIEVAAAFAVLTYQRYAARHLEHGRRLARRVPLITAPTSALPELGGATGRCVQEGFGHVAAVGYPGTSQ